MPTTWPVHRQRLLVLDAGDPEVGEQRPLPGVAREPPGPCAANEDVVGLEVAMNDPGGVGMGEGGAELGADVGHLAVGYLGGGGKLAQVRALHQLADEIGAPLVLT